MTNECELGYLGDPPVGGRMEGPTSLAEPRPAHFLEAGPIATTAAARNRVRRLVSCSPIVDAGA